MIGSLKYFEISSNILKYRKLIQGFYYSEKIFHIKGYLRVYPETKD